MCQEEYLFYRNSFQRHSPGCHHLAGSAEPASRERALGAGVRSPASSPGLAELVAARPLSRHPADSPTARGSAEVLPSVPSSGGERARGGGAAAPRAPPRTDRRVGTGKPAQHPAPTSGNSRRRSSFTRFQTHSQASRGGQPRLIKPKESSGYGARGTRESKRWLRKNDSVGFGDVSPLRR